MPSFSVSFSGRARGTAIVQPNGTFRTQLPAGDYRASPSALPAGYYLKSIVAGSVDLSQTPLEIRAAAPVDIVVTLGVLPKK